MKNTFLPSTSSGKLSLKLFALFILLILSGNVISKSINNTIEYPNPINSPLLGTAIYLAFITAAVASFVGIKAFVKDKERAVLVIIVMVIGGYFALAGSALLIAGMIELLK